MIDVLGITLPIFAAIAIGYGTVATKVFSSADMRVLGKFVMNIAFPALVFHTVAGRQLADVIHPGYLLAMALAGLLTLAIGYLLAAASGVGPARRAVAAMGISLPNSAYIGYPVMLLTLPDVAGQILAMNFMVENFLLIPICLTLLELSRPREGRSLGGIFARALWGLARKPFVIGLLLGLLVSLLQLPYPGPLERLAGILANSAGAVALVVIGGSLYGLPVKGQRGLSAAIAAGKLLLHPVLTLLAVTAVPLLGVAALPPDLWAAAILSAAMPMVAIYVVLAQPYGHEGLASFSLLMATAASFLTLTLLIAALV